MGPGRARGALVMAAGLALAATVVAAATGTPRAGRGAVAAPAAPVPQAAAPAAAPGDKPPADKPVDPQANPGRTIRGKLTPPDRVKEAVLWERSMDLKIPVTVDPQTGEFEVKGLRLGTYDFVIRTPWGRLEGLDMAPKVSPYDILIPPEYRTDDLGKMAEGTMTDDDRKAVRRIIYEVKRYENKIRDLYLAGSPDRAAALMELLMDGDFVGRKGDEITWRIEQWYYEKKYDAWNTFRTQVLYRFRISKAVWLSWGWQFEPALGGFDITEDRQSPITVQFTIPEKPVPEKGLTGNQYPPAEKGAVKDPKPPEEVQ